MDLFGWLKAIWCAVINLPAILADWIVALINAIFLVLGATLGAILSVLPTMPDAGVPDSQVLAYANWLVPIPALVASLVLVGTMVLVLLGVRVLLNWVKAF